MFKETSLRKRSGLPHTKDSLIPARRAGLKTQPGGGGGKQTEV